MRERRYGVNYFYDIELAEHILKWDRGWNSTITRRASNKVVEVRTGFKVDVEAVNLNLALIDSQVVGTPLPEPQLPRARTNPIILSSFLICGRISP